MPALKLDVLPANLDTGSSKHAQARVIVDKQGRAVAFVADHGKLTKVGELEGAEVETTGRRTYKITSGEQTWSCQKSGGCGCGSPLRRMNVSEALK